MNAINVHFKSLAVKLLAIYVPMVCIALLALFSIFELQYYRSERAALIDSLDRLVALQSSAFAAAMWEYDTKQVGVLLDEMARLPQFKSAAVVNESGEILHRIGTIEGEPEAPGLRADQRLIFVTAEAKEDVGRLIVTSHSGEIWKDVKRHVRVNALILVVLASALVGVTVLAARVVIGRPIGRLLQSIERMKTDRVLELVEWESADELGRVVDAYNEMQTELRRHQDHLEQLVAERTKQLERQKTVIEAVLANMDQGVIMYDADLKVEVFNEQARHHLKFSHQVLYEGTSFADLIRDLVRRGLSGDLDSEEQVAKSVASMRSSEAQTIELTTPDGTILELRRRPIQGGGVVATQTDITERRKAEKGAKLLQEALDNFSDMVILYDQDERRT